MSKNLDIHFATLKPGLAINQRLFRLRSPESIQAASDPKRHFFYVVSVRLSNCFESSSSKNLLQQSLAIARHSHSVKLEERNRLGNSRDELVEQLRHLNDGDSWVVAEVIHRR